MSIPFGFLVWMVLLAILISSMGIYYVVYTNEQVAITREIEQVHAQIARQHRQVAEIENRINEASGRWLVLENLDQSHSRLVGIEDSQREELKTTTRVSTASHP